MDIFTTQLVRVVSARIAPEKLKVKALLKDTALRKPQDELPETQDENYSLLFYHGRGRPPQQHSEHGVVVDCVDDAGCDIDKISENEDETNQHSHLDIFI